LGRSGNVVSGEKRIKLTSVSPDSVVKFDQNAVNIRLISDNLHRFSQKWRPKRYCFGSNLSQN
jgi:hypothetical protein